MSGFFTTDCFEGVFLEFAFLDVPHAGIEVALLQLSVLFLHQPASFAFLAVRIYDIPVKTSNISPRSETGWESCNQMTLMARPDIIGGEYQIKSHQLSDDFLDVYIVTDANGAQYEAQVFFPISEIPREREGLCQARRRRMKRIYRSSNFETEFEHNGRTVLVSRVQRNNKEWMDLQSQVGGQPRYENMPLATDYPPLENAEPRSDNFQSSSPYSLGQTVPSYAKMATKMDFVGPEVAPAGRRRVCLGLGGPRTH
ncbi:hypothetical protein CGCF415_v010829 [Colletotrichum fructicola]|nr:hypothetical protein CGCF415_v010829 [Colletotrichum fructicola]KAF4938360.1 hypothetical protein CGCF245_v004690 [Colletotrichum fructicola]